MVKKSDVPNKEKHILRLNILLRWRKRGINKIEHEWIKAKSKVDPYKKSPIMIET